MQSVSNFIENKLKLKVNTEKSQVCWSNQSKFLGYTIQGGGNLGIAAKSLERIKDKIRKITKHNRGRSFEQISGKNVSIDHPSPILADYSNILRINELGWSS